MSAYWERAIQGAITLAAVGAEAWPARRSHHAASPAGAQV